MRPYPFPFNWFPQRVGTTGYSWCMLVNLGFHSIGFPSEWGLSSYPSVQLRVVKFPFNWFPERVGTKLKKVSLKHLLKSFHSIGFPSEWGQCYLLRQYAHLVDSFHSIGFPSEWGR